ncbi:MAG: hypothetical protein ABIH66_13800 [bacterium]
MKERNAMKKTDGSIDSPKGKFPVIKRQMSKFLTCEEAKISTKGLVLGSVAVISLGIMAETALAAHTDGHNNWPHNSHSNHANGPYYTGHTNYAPHMSTSTHESQALTHTNAAAQHSNTASHASDATLLIPHTSAHTNAALSEAVTKGALHNDATAGYGKHSAGTGHYNVGIASRTLNAAGTGHSSTAPHASATTVPALNAAHHGSVSPHTNVPYPHINRSPSVLMTHSSHGSHGQW